jgi:Ran-binding protein 9/10
VSQGHIGEAIELVAKIFPKIFEFSREIVFRLKCQQFIELIRTGLREGLLVGSQQHYQEILCFGSDIQSEFINVQSDNAGFRKRLEEVFSLLAYNNPYECPAKHLLDDDERRSIAFALNDAIVSIYFGHKLPHSSLDRLSSHTWLVLKELGTTAGDPSAALISFESDLLSMVER